MLGDQLRRLRRDAGMTLRELAEKSGLSVGMLSQIENGSADPSLGSLRKLAAVFDADISSLFSDPEVEAVHISGPSTRMRLMTPGGEFSYERLTPGRGDLEMLRAVIPPGEATSPQSWSHPSTECVYVISGTLDVEVGGTSYTIQENESITFDSRLPHRYRNATQQDTTIVLAVTPPTP
nr:cupin domain-containing protein [Leucobacter rhizosphaerae]